MKATLVISLGGSLVVPGEIDVEYLRALKTLILESLDESPSRRFVFVVGGGATAREYQRAQRSIAPESTHRDLDSTGILATRLNAQLIRSAFEGYCVEPVVQDPTSVEEFTGRVLVAAGWKPGFSTDFDAVLLAERFGAQTLVNLTNIEKVFTADPKTDPEAKPIDRVMWHEFRRLIGDEWTPGMNAPFDPVAAQKAQEIGLTAITTSGKDLSNLRKILDGEDGYSGTTILPDDYHDEGRHVDTGRGR